MNYKIVYRAGKRPLQWLSSQFALPPLAVKYHPGEWAEAVAGPLFYHTSMEGVRYNMERSEGPNWRDEMWTCEVEPWPVSPTRMINLSELLMARADTLKLVEEFFDWPRTRGNRIRFVAQGVSLNTSELWPHTGLAKRIKLVERAEFVTARIQDYPKGE